LFNGRISTNKEKVKEEQRAANGTEILDEEITS
jgi:hypothetical protein